MSRNTNKILSVLLAVLMLASVMSVFGVSAADFGKVTMIDEVIATVTEPIAGQEPDYDVANEVQNATIVHVTWWRVENDITATAMKTGEKFVEGLTYECDVKFQVNGANIYFEENATGSINGKNVKVYVNETLSTATMYLQFECFNPVSDLEVLFTEDSKAQCLNNLTVDIEAMAELDDELMEAYLNDDVTFCWYLDGTVIEGYTDYSIDLTEAYCGHTVYVQVIYGGKTATSAVLNIDHYEAPHICEYDFDNPDNDTATCEDDGVYFYECIDPDCDNISTRPSPAKGHDFSEWEETVEAGCTNDGEKQRACVNCSEVETDVIPSFGGHTDDDGDRICDVCGGPLEGYNPGTSSGDEASKDEATGDEATKDEQDPLNDFYVGDVDLDGKVTIKDATMIQKALADILTLSYESETLADVDRDGKITIKDATAIQKYLAGLESGSAVGIPLGEVKG